MIGAGGAHWSGDGQHLRPLQHRHRPVQFAHRRADAGGPALRPIAGRRRAAGPRRRAYGQSCSDHSAPPGTATAATTQCSGDSRARIPRPSTPPSGPVRAAEIKRSGQLRLAGTQPIAFDAEDDLILHRRRRLPFHPNGMTFTAYADDEILAERTYYSIGGGFVLDDDGSGQPTLMPDPTPVPHPFRTGIDLLQICARPRPADQRRDVGQRVRPPARSRRTRGPAGDLAGDGGLHRARLRHAGRAARRPEGAPTGRGSVRPAARRVGPVRQRGRPAPGPGLGHPVGAGGQRGERLRRAGGHRPDQRRGRDHSGRAALRRHLRPQHR